MEGLISGGLLMGGLFQGAYMWRGLYQGAYNWRGLYQAYIRGFYYQGSCVRSLVNGRAFTRGLISGAKNMFQNEQQH